MRIGLQAKFMIPIVLMIVIGMGVSIATSYSRSTTAAKEAARERMHYHVLSAVRQLDIWIAARKTDLGTWGTNRVYRDALLEEGYYGKSARAGASEDLDKLIVGYPYYQQILLVDLQGRVRASSQSQAARPTIEFLESLHLLGQTFYGIASVSEFVMADEGGDGVFIVSSPVQVEGRVVGAMAGAVRVSTFTDQFFSREGSEFHSAEHTFLADVDGNILTSSPGTEEFTGNIADHVFGSELMRSPDNTVLYTENRSQRIASSRALAQTGWRYVATQSLDAAYASARERGRNGLIVGFLLVTAVVLTTFLLFRVLITNRLKQMLHVISEVEKGNLESRINGQFSSDEIGELTAAFNTMTEQLHETLTDLKGEIGERERAEDERRALEAQFLQAQKLESMGILAGGIAHDFNNILVGIMGNVDLAQTGLTAGEDVQINLKEIETASRRAADLCNQMLAYSGKGKFVVEKVDLNEVVTETTHLLEASVSKKHELKFLLSEKLPCIEADATQIRQVIMNLITNGSEAIGEASGVIRITTGVMDCDAAYLAKNWLKEPLPEGRYACIEICDTGCGMAPETLHKIFDPFFTTKFTGRGLGMAAVLGIVRGHHGAIIIQSKLSEGSTFTVLFPAANAEVTPSPESALGPEKLERGGTVLLVDDEKVVRDVVKRMLELLGFSVLTASDGIEALSCVEEHRGEIACVILDLAMPNMGGEETFLELRSRRIDVPVILASGYTEQEVKIRLNDAGRVQFLHKPYRTGDLKERLAKAMLPDS